MSGACMGLKCMSRDWAQHLWAAQLIPCLSTVSDVHAVVNMIVCKAKRSSRVLRLQISP